MISSIITVSPAQTVMFCGVLICGVGFTFNNASFVGPLQPFKVGVTVTRVVKLLNVPFGNVVNETLPTPFSARPMFMFSSL